MFREASEANRTQETLMSAVVVMKGGGGVKGHTQTLPSYAQTHTGVNTLVCDWLVIDRCLGC